MKWQNTMTTLGNYYTAPQSQDAVPAYRNNLLALHESMSVSQYKKIKKYVLILSSFWFVYNGGKRNHQSLLDWAHKEPL